jgi:Fe-S-cluster containining protein
MSDNTKKTPWYIAGLHFECLECGTCCSGPDEGYIWITRPEIELVAKHLKMPVDKVRRKYLKRIGLHTTIAEQPRSKDCVFLKSVDGKKICSVYPVRPNQCRTWPFWSGNILSPNVWNIAAMKCPGVNRGTLYSFEEIEKIRKQKKWWPGG